MEKYRKTPHTVYDIKYHFVWCPKYRFHVLEGEIKKRIKEIISQVCEELDILIVEGEICKDHVHLCVSVPPKHSPSYVMKRIKGTSSERIFREFPELRKRYWGQRFWARGYFVSIVGIDEKTIKRYIQGQREDTTSEQQLKFWK